MGRRIGVPQPLAPTTFELRCSIEQAPKLTFQRFRQQLTGRTECVETSYIGRAEPNASIAQPAVFRPRAVDKQDLPVGILPQRE